MSEVTITPAEINFLKKGMVKTINEIDVISESVSWNSNVKTYLPIANAINLKLSKKGEKKVAPSFLRNFFFYHDDVKSVRLTSIDRLYNYLFDKNRNDYLNELGINFEGKKHFLLHSDIVKRTTINLPKEDQHVEKKFFPLSTYSLESLIEFFEDKKNVIQIYIDENFIKDINGVCLLIELFCNRFLSLVVEYNLRFEFDPKILDPENEKTCILTATGQLNYFNFWKEREEYLNLLFENKDRAIINKIRGRELIVILKSLLKFRVHEDAQEVMRISTFLPIYKDLNQEKEVVDLSNIYEQQNGENLSEFNFLCVVGYEGYYRQKEKTEMLKYFSSFYHNLSDSNIVRIFTISGSRVKGKGWTSKMTLEQNIILYQYLYINMCSKIKTFCLFYDKEYENEANDILWHQDYVIKAENIKNENKDTLVESLKKLDSLRITQPFEKQSLFFAYPETHYGKNQCLIIKEETEPLYQIRMLKDFLNRLSNKNEHANLSEFNKDNLDAMRLKLNLNLLNKKEIERMHSETIEFFEYNIKN